MFLNRIGGTPAFPDIERIFVAKRSGTSRSNKYVGGEYYVTSNDKAVDVFEQVVASPPGITDLVQWCTCDVMLSYGPRPVAVVEDTTHIVRMNLYQRFPRLARAASRGVPGVVLQGTRGLDFRLRGDRWGLYRYLQAFEALARVHPDFPCIPIWYLSTPDEESCAEQRMTKYLIALLNNDETSVLQQRKEVVDELRRVLKDGVEGDIARDIPCIVHGGKEVVVRIGANPDKKSWREKGSGQMDPYLGLILAAKYIYCYDVSGSLIKPLIIEFTKLPPDFWFFNRPNTSSLYKTLAKQYADEERFLG